MPRFRTMRQIPFPFKRIFGRTVLHFTKPTLAVRFNSPTVVRVYLRPLRHSPQNDSLRQGPVSLPGNTPKAKDIPENLLSSPAVFPELSLTSRGELENGWSPELPQKYEPALPVRSVHHLDYGCLPVLRSVETWLPRLNSPPNPAGRRFALVAKALPPLSPTGPT